ncbi:uncharacterized protein LOC126374895 [Pectinophora gossypiella]|uniref:uncharacterized protein LOC126374895 n=1 Tax=Pectinophora gossypiella TaxID=13191 RepID=UPI00214E3D48|nr:uncharacterized protein LOC126374895 [Pectinophora gossypiella]
MGNNKKKGPKANVFKVAGAKSLKKTKAKAVNLGLKNIKQKVQDMDKEFVEINKNPKPKPSKAPIVPPQKKSDKKVTNEEVAKTVENIVKMDL